jgi:indolepyruvate ferredoxin oxidoreductase
LIAQYRSNIEQALSVIATTRGGEHYGTAVKLAELPEGIRGYGHVRARGIEAACEQEKSLLEALKRRVISMKKAA